MVFKRKSHKPNISDEEMKGLKWIRSPTKEEKMRVIRTSIILDYTDGCSDDRNQVMSNNEITELSGFM